MKKLIVGICLLVVLSQAQIQGIPKNLQRVASSDKSLYALPQEVTPQFTSSNRIFCSQLHWIFALDESGSMNGVRWEKLQWILYWFKWWLNIWHPYCAQYITAYTFDTRATLPPAQYYEYVSPTTFDPSTITINGGGTNFGQPLVRGL